MQLQLPPLKDHIIRVNGLIAFTSSILDTCMRQAGYSGARGCISSYG
jgi:hypothetical protein